MKYGITSLLQTEGKWYVFTNDTSDMHPAKILPLAYDYKKLKQKPDNHQPKYILDKYFKGVNIKNVETSKDN